MKAILKIPALPFHLKVFTNFRQVEKLGLHEGRSLSYGQFFNFKRLRDRKNSQFEHQSKALQGSVGTTSNP